MWENVDIEIVKRIMTNERSEAQKKFWALFLVWIIIVFIWYNGILAGTSHDSHNWIDEGIAIISLFSLLAVIIWTVVYEYLRKVRVVRNAQYMLISSCQGREKMRVKGTENITRGYYISFQKPDGRVSGWVKTSQEFFNKCTIGTPVLIIAEEQAEGDKMCAFDPARFEMDV